jgi:hypothetical protein
MKTLKDLEEMKNVPAMFGNQYNLLLMTLEDFYIAKLNGLDRIKAELSNWDNEAKKVIVNELVDMLLDRSLIGFDPKEITGLIN